MKDEPQVNEAIALVNQALVIVNTPDPIPRDELRGVLRQAKNTLTDFRDGQLTLESIRGIL